MNVKETLRIIQSNYVPRYGTRPMLSGTQTNGLHIANGAMLIRAIWSDIGTEARLQIMEAWLCHDAHEIVTGDIPYGAPYALVAARNLCAEIFDQSHGIPRMGKITKQCVRLIDRLEPIVHVAAVAPHVLSEQEWLDGRDRVECLAREVETVFPGTAAKVALCLDVIAEME